MYSFFDFFQPMLHSVSFLHHLKLGHYEDAYASLEANPEAARRNNCLCDLVGALVAAREVRLLLDLPFTGMLARLESQLESWARARDPIYYIVLFSLHIKNMNYRKGK